MADTLLGCCRGGAGVQAVGFIQRSGLAGWGQLLLTCVCHHPAIEVGDRLQERADLHREGRVDARGAHERAARVREAGAHREELSSPQIEFHLFGHRLSIRRLLTTSVAARRARRAVS